MLIALTILLKQAGNFVGGFSASIPLIVGLLSLVMVFISLVLITDNSFGESLTKLGNIGGSENGYYSSFLTGVLAVVVASPCCLSWELLLDMPLFSLLKLFQYFYLVTRVFTSLFAFGSKA